MGGSPFKSITNYSNKESGTITGPGIITYLLQKTNLNIDDRYGYIVVDGINVYEAGKTYIFKSSVEFKSTYSGYGTTATIALFND